jgi:MYXO-CTERM domain-containing protein
LRYSTHRQLPALIPSGCVIWDLEKDTSMETKLWKFVGAATIGGAILISSSVGAQQSGSAQSAQSDNASSGQSSSMEQRRDDEKNDWGWLGLLGLIGLAGLRRKRGDDDGRRHTVHRAA